MSIRLRASYSSSASSLIKVNRGRYYVVRLSYDRNKRLLGTPTPPPPFSTTTNILNVERSRSAIFSVADFLEMATNDVPTFAKSLGRMAQDALKFWFWTVVDGVVLVFHILYIYLESFVKLLLPKPLKSLEGEIILITGAGNGIGKDVVLQLAKSRAKLVCWDILKKDNEETVEVLKCMGAEAYAYQVDVSDRSQVDAASERVRREIGDVTVIINNAGIGTCDKFLNFSPEHVEKTFQINVLAHFWILHQFLPQMVKNNRGHIVTVCSIGGIKGNRYMVPYHGSKFAVHGYLEALKEELAHSPNSGDKINFTTVYPTAVKTRLINGIRFSFRFPSFTPFLESSYVADKIITGLRSNTEKVYVPWYMPFYFFMECFLPTKAQRALTDYLLFDFCRDLSVKHFERNSNHSLANGNGH